MQNPSSFSAFRHPSFIASDARQFVAVASAAFLLLATAASAQTPATASKPLD
jgi:hypothetical protein